jgi:flagellin-like hook-associated protein FlgL
MSHTKTPIWSRIFAIVLPGMIVASLPTTVFAENVSYNAAEAQESIDNGLATLDNLQATLGAAQNRF